jgi:hypothetical protein
LMCILLWLYLFMSFSSKRARSIQSPISMA